MHWRRLFQFRLRTLLIVATLFCVALAFIIIPARRQRQAVLELQRSNARVIYKRTSDDDTSPGPWSQVWLGCDFRQRVETIHLARHPALTERDWQLILICQPRELAIAATEQGDRDLERLPGLRSLHWLSIENPSTTEQSWEHVGKLHDLRELYAVKTNITDSGLARLATLHNLNWLHLSRKNNTAEGVAELRRSLPKCDIVFDSWYDGLLWIK